MTELTKSTLTDPTKFEDPVWGGNQLKRIPVFCRFSDGELEDLYNHGKLVIIKPGVSAVIEGEPTRGLFILLAGTVSVFKNIAGSSGMHRLAYLEEGSYFGEFSLFDDAPRSATVTAESACYLFQLDVDEFLKFLDKSGHEAKVRFYKTCAEELAKRFRHLNTDYITSQKILWKYALRKDDGADQKG